MDYKPPVRGKGIRKQEGQQASFSDPKFIADQMYEMRKLQEEVRSTLDSKVSEIDQVIAEKSKELDGIVESAKEELVEVAQHVVDEVQALESLQGEPGTPADEDSVTEKVLARVPKLDTAKLKKEILSEVPKFDPKALKKEILSSIPDRKSDLKVIQESMDPESMIEKIMALPAEKRSKLQLVTSNISGLDQTMSAMKTQIGSRGYVHGGGDTVSAGTNITITPGPNGTKQINSTGGSGGVSSFNGLIGDVTISEGTDITFNQTGNDIQISSLGGNQNLQDVLGVGNINGDISILGSDFLTAYKDDGISVLRNSKGITIIGDDLNGNAYLAGTNSAGANPTNTFVGFTSNGMPESHFDGSTADVQNLAFSGSGLDDMTPSSGNYAGTGSSYTVTVVATDAISVDYTNLVGSFQVGEIVDDSDGSTGTILYDSGTRFVVGSVTGGLFGTGTLAGQTSGATADQVGSGTQQDFWTSDDGLTQIEFQEMRFGPHFVQYNAQVDFGSITGHTPGDFWTFDVVLTPFTRRAFLLNFVSQQYWLGGSDFSDTVYAVADVNSSQFLIKGSDGGGNDSNAYFGGGGSGISFVDSGGTMSSSLSVDSSGTTIRTSDLITGSNSIISGTPSSIGMSYTDGILGATGQVTMDVSGVTISGNNGIDQLIVDSAQDYMYYRRSGTTYIEVAPATILGNGTLARFGAGAQASWEMRNDPSLVANLADAAAALYVVDSTNQPWLTISPSTTNARFGDGVVVGTIDLTGNAMTYSILDGTGYMHFDRPGLTIMSILAQTDQVSFNAGITVYVNVIANDASHTITSSEYCIEMHPVTTNVTCTLPASPNRGDTYEVKLAELVLHNVTVSGNGHNIDNSPTVTLTGNLVTMPSQTYRYNGTQWSIY